MWDCPAGHSHWYLRKMWKFSNDHVLVFVLRRASCIFILSRDRVTCITWVLGEFLEMLHTSWPTLFMSLCIGGDLILLWQIKWAFLYVILKYNQIVVACLWDMNDVYGNVLTACMDGWMWMFLYWPHSSHLSPMQRLKTSIWKVYGRASLMTACSITQNHHYFITKKKTAWLGAKAKNVIRRNWSAKLFKRKETLFSARANTIHNVWKEVMGHVKRETGKWCVKQIAKLSFYVASDFLHIISSTLGCNVSSQ